VVSGEWSMVNRT